MKCLSIQQPWATLIAYGIKDVENRPDRKLVPPQRVLIHVGAKSRDSLDEIPLGYKLSLDFADEIGAFNPETALVRSAIIGYVDIVDIVTDSQSLWAQYNAEGEKPMQHYILENARLFKNPIQGVKGRLGVWDIPEIDENNLPETVDIPKLERDGDRLVIPLCDEMWAQVSEWHESADESDMEIVLTALNSNIGYFFRVPESEDEDFETLPTNTVVIKSSNGKEIETKFVDADIEVLTWDDDNEPILYEDEAGNEYMACKIHIFLKKQ